MTLSIHDYSIYQYLITQSDSQPSSYVLTLYTKSHGQDDNKYVDVVFHNTHTHYFIGTMMHTILFNIELVSLEYIYQDYRELFEQMQYHEWPLPYHSIEEAAKYLQARRLQVYHISSSYGLVDGWVIAERIELRERTQQKIFDEEKQ